MAVKIGKSVKWLCIEHLHTMVYGGGAKAKKNILKALKVDDDTLKMLEDYHRTIVNNFDYSSFSTEQLKQALDDDKNAFYSVYGKDIVDGCNEGDIILEGDERINKTKEKLYLILHLKVKALKVFHIDSCTRLVPLLLFIEECYCQLAGEALGLKEQYGDSIRFKIDRIIKCQQEWYMSTSKYVRHYMRDGICTNLSTFTHEYEIGESGMLDLQSTIRRHVLAKFDLMKNGTKGFLKSYNISENRKSVALLFCLWALTRYAQIIAYKYNDILRSIVGSNGKVPTICTEPLDGMMKKSLECLNVILGASQVQDLIPCLTSIDGLVKAFEYADCDDRVKDFIYAKERARDNYFYYFIGRNAVEYLENGKLIVPAETDIKLLAKATGLDNMFLLRFKKDIKMLASNLDGEDTESAKWIGKVCRSIIEENPDKYKAIKKLKMFYL